MKLFQYSHGGPDTSDFEIALDTAICSGKVREAWLESLTDDQVNEALREYFDACIADSLSDEDMVKLLGWDDY